MVKFMPLALVIRKVPKVTLTCHPDAKPKDLANEKEILRFAQNDSFAVTLVHLFREYNITANLRQTYFSPSATSRLDLSRFWS
jgi:hypothetical protein